MAFRMNSSQELRSNWYENSLGKSSFSSKILLILTECRSCIFVNFIELLIVLNINIFEIRWTINLFSFHECDAIDRYTTPFVIWLDTKRNGSLLDHNFTTYRLHTVLILLFILWSTISALCNTNRAKNSVSNLCWGTFFKFHHHHEYIWDQKESKRKIYSLFCFNPSKNRSMLLEFVRAIKM